MTVIINRQEELEALIDKYNIIIDGDLRINCDIDIEAHIKARNIKAKNIQALDIDAWDIDANDIKAWNIKADDIKAGNIYAFDINAGNINAGNIYALDIKAWNIKANDIEANNIKADDINAEKIDYYAFCIAIESLKCKTIEGRRENSLHACLDQSIERKIRSYIS